MSSSNSKLHTTDKLVRHVLSEKRQRCTVSSQVTLCGIWNRHPEQAKQVGALADGVIVGSACVKAIGENENPVEAAKEFANSFKGALE